MANSFNSMQSGIAGLESQLLHVARHDAATGFLSRSWKNGWNSGWRWRTIRPAWSSCS